MVGLPNSIYITRAYTDMKLGSHQVSVIIRNLTSRPIHLPRGKTVTRVLASNAVLSAKPSPQLLKKLEADAPTKLTLEFGGETQATACHPQKGQWTRMTLTFLTDPPNFLYPYSATVFL